MSGPCARRRFHGPAVVGNLCKKCAAWEHPGQTFFRGRWRTLEEVHIWFMSRPEMRGVTWAVESLDGREFFVGRKGGFEIRLRMELAA